MRRSFRGPRVIVPKANEKVAFGASPKLTNFRLYLLSHEELLTQDSGLSLHPPDDSNSQKGTKPGYSTSQRARKCCSPPTSSGEKWRTVFPECHASTQTEQAQEGLPATMR